MSQGFRTRELSLKYQNLSVDSLTARQAQGLDPVIAADSGRSSLKIVPEADCLLILTPGDTAGIPLYGGVENTFQGSQCPSNALFVTGLEAGSTLTIWEG